MSNQLVKCRDLSVYTCTSVEEDTATIIILLGGPHLHGFDSYSLGLLGLPFDHEQSVEAVLSTRIFWVILLYRII